LIQCSMPVRREPSSGTPCTRDSMHPGRGGLHYLICSALCLRAQSGQIPCVKSASECTVM
jgi:hypothetical protein